MLGYGPTDTPIEATTGEERIVGVLCWMLWDANC